MLLVLAPQFTSIISELGSIDVGIGRCALAMIHNRDDDDEALPLGCSITMIVD